MFIECLIHKQMHDARIVALLHMLMNDFSYVAHGPEKDLRDVKEDEHCIPSQKQKKTQKKQFKCICIYTSYIFIYDHMYRNFNFPLKKIQSSTQLRLIGTWVFPDGSTGDLVFSSAETKRVG